MTKPLFLFVHGWAGTPRLWDGVCAQMVAAGVGDGDVVSLTLPNADADGPLPLPLSWARGGNFAPLPLAGEGGAYRASDGRVRAQTTRPVIGVGHSLGAAWLLAHGPALSGFVAINGFTRFTSAPDFPAGTHPRVLAQMRRRLLADAPAVLADFHARAGLALPDDLASAEELAKGLDLLGSIDARDAFGVFARPWLALCGTDDAIVPPAHAAACFPEPVMLEGVGHALPQVRPDLCARHILELAARC